MVPLQIMRLGFLGVGHMGAAMAANLLKSGLKVVVCDPSAEAVARLCKLGATSAPTPQALGQVPGLDAVVSMLPSSQAVRTAYLQEGIGLLTGEPRTLRPRILIDSSTIDPLTAREVAAAAGSTLLHEAVRDAHGAEFAEMIDAPVSGGVRGAQAATLTFMCGGSNAGVEAATPFLEKMGKRVVRCGDSGAGQAAKLANNLVLAVQMAAVSEGLAFGQRLGLDPALLSSIFNTSSAQSWVTSQYSPVPGVMEGVPSSCGYQHGFATALMLKDLALAVETARQSGAKLPLTELAQQQYQRVAERSSPALDFSQIYQLYRGGDGVL